MIASFPLNLWAFRADDFEVASVASRMGHPGIDRANRFAYRFGDTCSARAALLLSGVSVPRGGAERRQAALGRMRERHSALKTHWPKLSILECERLPRNLCLAWLELSFVAYVVLFASTDVLARLIQAVSHAPFSPIPLAAGVGLVAFGFCFFSGLSCGLWSADVKKALGTTRGRLAFIGTADELSVESLPGSGWETQLRFQLAGTAFIFLVGFLPLMMSAR